MQSAPAPQRRPIKGLPKRRGMGGAPAAAPAPAAPSPTGGLFAGLGAPRKETPSFGPSSAATAPAPAAEPKPEPAGVPPAAAREYYTSLRGLNVSLFRELLRLVQESDELGNMSKALGQLASTYGDHARAIEARVSGTVPGGAPAVQPAEPPEPAPSAESAPAEGASESDKPSGRLTPATDATNESHGAPPSITSSASSLTGLPESTEPGMTVPNPASRPLFSTLESSKEPFFGPCPPPLSSFGDSPLSKTFTYGSMTPKSSASQPPPFMAGSDLPFGKDAIATKPHLTDSGIGGLRSLTGQQNITAPVSAEPVSSAAPVDAATQVAPSLSSDTLGIKAPSATPIGDIEVAPPKIPTAVPATEPASEPASEPAAAPASEPAPKPATAPASEPVPKPATAPPSEPAAKPSGAPAPEPAATPAAAPPKAPSADLSKPFSFAGQPASSILASGAKSHAKTDAVPKFTIPAGGFSFAGSPLSKGEAQVGSESAKASAKDEQSGTGETASAKPVTTQGVTPSAPAPSPSRSVGTDTSIQFGSAAADTSASSASSNTHSPSQPPPHRFSFGMHSAESPSSPQGSAAPGASFTKAAIGPAFANTSGVSFGGKFSFGSAPIAFGREEGDSKKPQQDNGSK